MDKEYHIPCTLADFCTKTIQTNYPVHRSTICHIFSYRHKFQERRPMSNAVVLPKYSLRLTP